MSWRDSVAELQAAWDRIELFRIRTSRMRGLYRHRRRMRRFK